MGGATGQGGITTAGGSTGSTATSGSGGREGSGGTPATGGTISAGGTTSGSGGSASGTGGGSGGSGSGTGGGSGGSVGGTGGGSGGSVGGTGGSGGGPGSGTGGAATGGTRAPGSGGASTGGRTADASAGVGGAADGGGLGGEVGRGGAGGQTGTGGDGGGTGGGGGVACGSTLPAVTDYSAAGPFATTTDSKTGPDGQCTIFRPKTLGENGFLHAPIVFGPGIGMQATQLQGLLLGFASHGFVVIGTGVLNGGPNDPANKSAMQNALTWIIQQNSQSGTYQGKLAVKCAISMGYSVGGTAAVEIGGDPAVATVVSIHGHKATAALHGTMLQTSGTNDTVGLPMQQYTFDQSQVQTFMGTVTGADHGYIQQNNGGVQRPAIVAWLRYWIYNDTGAKNYFYGDTCVMCTSPWTNPQRKNWQ